MFSWNQQMGLDAFMFACMEGHLDIAEYLIDMVDLDQEVDQVTLTSLGMDCVNNEIFVVNNEGWGFSVTSGR